MPPTHLTTFDGLRRRLGGTSVHPNERAIKAEFLFEYLRNLGFSITSADDVPGAIEADPSEEELSAYRCAEGIAVAHASDGWWLLFPTGGLDSAARVASSRSSSALGSSSC